MIEEEEDIPRDYVSGFNDGFLLAKHEFALYKQTMLSTKSNNLESDYLRGLKAGGIEYQLEQALLQQKDLTDWEQQMRTSSTKPNHLNDLDY